jgi:hypothetical protein
MGTIHYYWILIGPSFAVQYIMDSNPIALLQLFPKKAVNPKILQQRKSSAIMSWPLN